MKLLDLDDVSVCDLEFTASVNQLGEHKEEELKPGGADCTVRRGGGRCLKVVFSRFYLRVALWWVCAHVLLAPSPPPPVFFKVTNDNLEEYLGLQCKYRLLDRVSEQVTGFNPSECGRFKRQEPC